MASCTFHRNSSHSRSFQGTLKVTILAQMPKWFLFIHCQNMFPKFHFLPVLFIAQFSGKSNSNHSCCYSDTLSSVWVPPTSLPCKTRSKEGMDIWPVRGGGCIQMRGLRDFLPICWKRQSWDLRQNCCWAEPGNNPGHVLRQWHRGTGCKASLVTTSRIRWNKRISASKTVL